MPHRVNAYETPPEFSKFNLIKCSCAHADKRETVRIVHELQTQTYMQVYTHTAHKNKNFRFVAMLRDAADHSYTQYLSIHNYTKSRRSLEV